MASRLARYAAASVAALFLTTALAQYTYQPFFDQPLIQSRAYGRDLVLQRLRVVDAFEAPLDDELMEQVEMLLSSDVNRFIGTLRAADPVLAADLLGALDEVEEAVEEGEDASEAVLEARQLALRAYDLVVPAEVRKSPTFIGALIADLVLGEGGVAEGYEEAIGDEEPYLFTSGWSALQGVKALWEQLAVYATPQQKADVEEMIVQLDAIYFAAEPPEISLAGPMAS